MKFSYTVILLLSLFIGNGLYAQSPASGDLGRIPLIQLPSLDNDRLLQEELAARRPGRAPRFAATHDVDIRPTTHGQWRRLDDGMMSWRLRLSSPNAKSLNLGFMEYLMPPGGRLYLYPGGQKQPKVHGPFTPADNEIHKQLWTQVIDGDDLVVEVILPAAEQSALQLWLTQVNHDFLGFTQASSASGSCNLDVICSAADGWGIVDQYRDIIRSVAVYSTGGTTFCSGFLVNNTRQDCTPYFMTADHCEIVAGNAPSLVVYWNFLNSVCRQPNSVESGQAGDGQLVEFNTGATLRASHAASDMTLLLLDDPISPESEVFYAGWSREETPPQDTTIVVHHPRTDEKRISFSFQNTFRADGLAGPTNPNGTHIEVPDYDIGTTEGGSSGSPIFDRFKRVRGQLHGGFASCGNDDSDRYGFFFTSWTGGGTPGTRLSDWLDPEGTNVMTLDGRDYFRCETSVVAQNPNRQECSNTVLTYSLEVGGGFSGPVDISTSGVPTGLNVNLSTSSAVAGDFVTVTVAPDTDLSGFFEFMIEATDGTEIGVSTLSVEYVATVPETPSPLSPMAGATDLPLRTEIVWFPNGGDGYEYTIATDEAFSEIVYNGSTTGSSFSVPTPLDGQTVYFWRVRSLNVCGASEWSSTRSFTTINQICGAAVSSTNVPVTIPTSGSPTVTSTLEMNTNDPISALSVDLNIQHTFIGDIEATLTSPSGTVVRLFDRLGSDGAGFGCGGMDLLITLADDAENTASDLENTCNEQPAASGSYRPLDPFSSLAGESPQGTWTLTVEDNASFDGGEIVDWGITFCGGRDLSLRGQLDTLTSCLGEKVDFDVVVGNDFGNAPEVIVRLGDNVLQNVSTTFDPGSRLLRLVFDGFAEFNTGTNVVTLTVRSGMSNNTLEFAVVIPGPPNAAELISPTEGASVGEATITFNWSASPETERYVLQVSEDPLFVVLSRADTVNETSLTINNNFTEGQLYWRVISLGDCANGVSTTRSFIVSPNAVFSFGQLTQLSIYPNPVSGQSLFVEISGSLRQPLRAEWFTLDGRRLQVQSFPASPKVQLEMPTTTGGTYLLRLTSGKASTTARIVHLPR